MISEGKCSGEVAMFEIKGFKDFAKLDEKEPLKEKEMIAAQCDSLIKGWKEETSLEEKEVKKDALLEFILNHICKQSVKNKKMEFVIPSNT